MRVLGLDPATVVMGYGVIDGPKPLRYVEAGTLNAPKRDHRDSRIITIGSDLRALILEFKPDAIAVETAMWGGHGAAPGALGEIRGVILWLAHEAGVPLHSYAPKEARAGIGIGGSADKATVARYVARVLCLQKTPDTDAGDALGVAMCHALRG